MLFEAGDDAQHENDDVDQQAEQVAVVHREDQPQLDAAEEQLGIVHIAVTVKHQKGKETDHEQKFIFHLSSFIFEA